MPADAIVPGIPRREPCSCMRGRSGGLDVCCKVAAVASGPSPFFLGRRAWPDDDTDHCMVIHTDACR